MSNYKMAVIDDNGKLVHRPVCNGTYTASEYDSGPGILVHDEHTYCPVCDNTNPSSITVRTLSNRPIQSFVLSKDPSHGGTKNQSPGTLIPNEVRHRCEELSAVCYSDSIRVALEDAAKTILSMEKEVALHQLMNANQGWVIWDALGKAMFGHTNHTPSDEIIKDAIEGMPQEWAMVQEAIARLKAQPFSLDDYQHRCGDTADYPEAGTGSNAAITYCVLGLTGEAGEVADKWKKVMRGDHGDGDVSQEVKDMMVKEVGDTTWFAARLSIELGAKLSTVAQGNLDKLESRKRRGVIKGSGDIR